MRSRFGRAEVCDTGRAKRIAKAGNQRRFGSDDDEANFVFAAERDDGVMFADVERNAICQRRNASIARSAIEFAEKRA